MLRRSASGLGVRRVVNIARGSSFTNARGRYWRRARGSQKAKGYAKPKYYTPEAEEPEEPEEPEDEENAGGKMTREKAGNESKKMKELLDLSRTMTDVFSKSLDSMLKISRNAQSTATAMKSLAETQSGKKVQGWGFKQGTPGTFYEKLGFSGGNTGAPLTRDYLESKAQQLVEIKVVFIRINEIDTVNQTFDAELYIQARWRERRFLGYSELALADIEFYQCTDPQLKILNVVGELSKNETNMMLRYEPDSFSPVLVYMWHVQGIFKERMELEHFPFDVQELSVVISTDQPTGVVELAGDFGQASSINMSALEACQDWSNYMHVEVTRDLSSREINDVNKHSVLVVSARVKRNLGFYFWDIALIVIMIEAMTFCFLAVDVVGSNRLSFSVTLFFTAVAYKLVVKNYLPNISYLTYLDVYIAFVMAYLFIWSGVNALLSHLARYRERQRVLEYDQIAQFCLIGFLILFHIFFILYIFFTAMARRRKMNKLEVQYKLAKLMRQGHLSRPMFHEQTDKKTGLQTAV